jgi:hypothetical protein
MDAWCTNGTGRAKQPQEIALATKSDVQALGKMRDFAGTRRSRRKSLE